MAKNRSISRIIYLSVFLEQAGNVHRWIDWLAAVTWVTGSLLPQD